MPNPWVVQWETVDEDGRPERWTFHYKRMVRRDSITLSEWSQEKLNNARNVDIFPELQPMIIRKIERNGAPFDDYDELPVDVLEQSIELYPSFQRNREDGDGASQ